MTTRREFAWLLCAAPFVASGAVAQSRARVWRLGYLIQPPLSESPSPERAAFLAALRELGYMVGGNLAIEYRSANSDRELLPFLAEELVQAKVDAIVVGSSDPARAALDATQSVPIIMLGVADPVAFGLVTNLARPGSNITGMSWQSLDLIGKRFGLLKEALPRTTRVAYLWNPDTVAATALYPATQEAAGKIGMALDELRVSNSEQLQSAIQALERRRPDALYVNVDNRIATYRQFIADAAIRLRLPSVSGYHGYVEAGGLMSYGASLTDLYHRAASYVDRVFRGAKPGDLPIEQPTKFDLVINLKTANALGLALPQTLLLQATEVIR